jgi:hypothetical protein
MKVPEFQAVAKLQQGATAAATTLLKVMLDQGTPASVKVRAAECAMTNSSGAIEIEDVEAWVSGLLPGFRRPFASAPCTPLR